jgi:predicted nucleic acid-binding protein
MEFWVSATRPITSNGFGWEPERASREIEEIKKIFTILNDPPELHETWLKLVTKYRIRGKKSHDVRLVASMILMEMTDIITFNIKDFQNFSEINLISPFSFAQKGLE